MSELLTVCQWGHCVLGFVAALFLLLVHACFLRTASPPGGRVRMVLRAMTSSYQMAKCLSLKDRLLSITLIVLQFYLTTRAQKIFSFRLLLGQAPNLVRIITDFERGLRNACQLVFPGVTLQGCFFHLVQVSRDTYVGIIFKKIQGIKSVLLIAHGRHS